MTVRVPAARPPTSRHVRPPVPDRVTVRVPAGRPRAAPWHARGRQWRLAVVRVPAARPRGTPRRVSVLADRRPSVVPDTGLSLIEAIVALALTLVLLGAAWAAVRPALLLNRTLPAMADGQQRLRHAFDRLHAGLTAAGRGTTRVAPGPLRRILPPVVPYRMGRRAGDREHLQVRSDAITTLSVSAEGGAETRLLNATAGSGAEVRLPPGPGCVRRGCGYRVGDLALVFDDRPAWGLFRVSGIGEGTLVLDKVGPGTAAFAAGAAIAPLDVRHYYFDSARRQLRRYDGWRGDFPVVDGLAALRFRFFGVAAVSGPPPCVASAPSGAAGRLVEIALAEFSDGPWCGPAGSPFDEDLLRVRAVGFDVRVENAAGGGTADYGVTAVVAPPNLAMAGSRAGE